jgi:hypothetical protein
VVLRLSSGIRFGLSVTVVTITIATISLGFSLGVIAFGLSKCLSKTDSISFTLLLVVLNTIEVIIHCKFSFYTR